MIKIREIKDQHEMENFYPLIRQLNPGLSRQRYKKMLNDMVKAGYRMAAAYESASCIGVSGFWIATKIYCGKYVEIDNLVIDKQHRSKGTGKKLCDFILRLARKSGCETAMLDAYAENSLAHRFYYREGFIVRGFHFIKKLQM